MSIEYNVNFSRQDMAGQHEALLQGGPYHGSIVRIQSKRCTSITITEDGDQRIYMNTQSTNSDGKHIFLHKVS